MSIRSSKLPSPSLTVISEALSELSSIRQTTLLNSFIDALTRGGPGGMPRPIELHAHDPGRYVGDMLAWVHQAMAGEQEFLESLFGVKQARMVGSVRQTGQGEEEGWVRRLMDEDLEKLCLPLKVRQAYRLLYTIIDGWAYSTAVGPGTTDDAIARGQHNSLHDRQPPAILSAHDAADGRRAGSPHEDSARVRS